MKTRLGNGFSLVETVLAMGIVSFAMLGILGLVPLGLSHFRQAMTMTAESQILQGLSNDLLLADYDKLVNQFTVSGGKVTYYYDDQGGEVDSGAEERLYTVTVELVDLAAADLSSTAGKTAAIQIASDTQSHAVKKYSLIVPKG
jgi:uncharacterized protein (TIGR02598 family)